VILDEGIKVIFKDDFSCPGRATHLSTAIGILDGPQHLLSHYCDKFRHVLSSLSRGIYAVDDNHPTLFPTMFIKNDKFIE